MFKKIMREISLSTKRNPVKIVLIGLILLISSNLVFAGLSLYKELSDVETRMKTNTEKTISIKYIDSSIVDPREKSSDEGFPLMYEKDFPQLLDDRVGGGMSVSGISYLTTLNENHKAFDESKYKGKSIASLGLRKDAFHIELVTDYGVKYLAWDFINHYKREFTMYEDINIVEGRKFEKMEDSVIMIPEGMAEKTGLEVGDSIDFTYDRRPVDFKIVGVFKTDDEGLSEDVILAQGGEERLYDTALSWGSGYSISASIVLYPDAKDSELYLELLNDHLAKDYSNLIATNKVEEYAPFVRSLKTAKMVSLVFVFVVIGLSVLALWKVIKNDIESYQKDAFVSIYEEDKKIVKMSNYMQVLILVMISMMIAVFTAPALNKTLAKPLLRNNLNFVNEVYPNYEFADFAEVITFYNNDEEGVMQTLSPDIVLVASMDYTLQPVSIIYAGGTYDYNKWLRRIAWK